MNDLASEHVGPMLNPPHLGERIRESMDDVDWNVTETAARLGCERGTLSRLLNGNAGSRGVQNETYSVGLRFAPPTYGLRTETPSSILMRDSAGIPKPLCRRQIIFSVSVRLRFNTS